MDRTVNILHITTNHTAFDDRIFFKQAKSLCNLGQVSILSYSKDGKIRDMSGEKFNPGTFDNIEQYSLKSPQPKSRFISKLKKIFWVLIKRSIFPEDKTLIKNDIVNFVCNLNKPPHIVHIHEPSLLLTAYEIKKRIDCKLIYDAHELELLYAFDKPIPKIRQLYNFLLLKHIMQKVLDHIDATISVNNYVRTSLLMMSPNGSHHTIQNGSLFSGSNFGLRKDKIVLVHEGSLIFNRGLKLMIDMFDDPWIREHILLKVIGKLGKDEEKYLKGCIIHYPFLKNCIEFTGWVNYLNVEKHLANCQIGIIFMEPNYNNLIASPNKLYNYLACRLPVISVDLAPSSDLINKNGVGIIIQRNVESLKKAIHKIVENYSQFLDNIENSREEVLWSTEEIKLINIYKDLLSNGKNET